MSNTAYLSHLLQLRSFAPTAMPWMILGEALRIPAPRGVLDGTLRAMSSTSSEGAAVTHSLPSSSAAKSVDGNEASQVPPGPASGSTDTEHSPPKGKFAIDGELSMEDLIREHSDAVYRVALSVTRDPSLAEDVSQDALIKAWRALPSFRGDSPLRNWVLRITHNTAISALRKRRDELREPTKLPERETLRSVESTVQDRLAIDRFQEALADLDSVSRSIVVLREVEGLSYSELCDVLDLPMPTIKTRLLRARRQLAQALEGWQP